MITQAFILGAGLGTRLRPLTDHFPKPLVPLFHKPLAQWALETCASVGCDRFAINTHHLPEKWKGFGENYDITFFHETTLLETGGGLKNIESWISPGSLLIHNGDIFSSMDHSQLIKAHEESGDEVTLALRSQESEKRIALGENQRVIDIRSEVFGHRSTHAFTGICCVKKEFLARIPAHTILSIIPVFQDLVKLGLIGGVVLDQGVWMDLGDIPSYLSAHTELNLQEPIHPLAHCAKGAIIERSVIGANARVAADSVIKDSVLWPGVKVSGIITNAVIM